VITHPTDQAGVIDGDTHDTRQPRAGGPKHRATRALLRAPGVHPGARGRLPSLARKPRKSLAIALGSGAASEPALMDHAAGSRRTSPSTRKGAPVARRPDARSRGKGLVRGRPAARSRRRRRRPVSSMKGRVLSRGGWPFLMFVCGVGVVIVGIRGRKRGFGARPRTSLESCRARPVGSSALRAGRASRRRWWRLTRRVESGIGLGGGGVMGLWWLGAGSLTALRLGRRLQSSIRSRGADQSVVRCSGAQSTSRPSLSMSRRRPDTGASSPERAPRALVRATVVCAGVGHAALASSSWSWLSMSGWCLRQRISPSRSP
jgi:hypothetical protein